MRINQKGALDLMLVAALVIVVAVGAFVLMRISADSESDSQASSQSEMELPPNTFIDAQGNEQTVADYQDCLDWAFPTEVRDGVTYCVGPDGIEFAEPMEDEDTLETEEHSDVTKYTNTKFGFSLEFPSKVDVDGYVTDFTSDTEGLSGGKRLSLNGYEGEIFVTAATEDFFVSKGPLSLTYVLATGYDEQSFEDVDEEAFVASGGAEGVYFSNTPTFGDLGTDFTYVFNTDIGGLTISTQDPTQLELLQEIADTVTIL